MLISFFARKCRPLQSLYITTTIKGHIHLNISKASSPKAQSHN